MPKLKDQFNQDLYEAFVQCGFSVGIGTEVPEVVDAELPIASHEAVWVSGEDTTDKGCTFRMMYGDPSDAEGGENLAGTLIFFNTTDDVEAMKKKIKYHLNQLVPDVDLTEKPLSENAPETVQEVPTINKKDLVQKRDRLLDKLNTLPEGDPKREQVKEQLKSLRAGLHRVSFDIEVPVGSNISLQQYLEAVQKLHIQLSGSLSYTSIGVNHVRDPLPKVSVGERVLIASNVDLVDSVYFSDGFHCGYHIPEEAVDLGKYKIAVKQGSYATVNSINGSSINLIEVSELGIISAYDHIKGKEISNQVQVHSCTVDLQNLKKVQGTVQIKGSSERCNCENSGCMDHEGGACSHIADGANRAIYIGPICSSCSKIMPEKYMTMIDGKSTGRD